MKTITNWLRALALTIIATAALPAQGQGTDSPNALDSLEVSLVTCEPHEMIYALYGHTGIRIRNLRTGEDLLANWGIFAQNQRFFVVRFAFGLTDYRMDLETWEGFCERYNYYRCGIYEQVLDLTAAEKQKVLSAVLTNYLPENRYYRYNFYYDNCTTRARDILEENLDGRILYAPEDTTPTWRQQIRVWNYDHLWARWGNDFLLGMGSDKKTNQRQQQFLPDKLKRDFTKAVIDRNGQRRRLVKAEHWATPSQYNYHSSTLADQLTSPRCAALYLFLLTLAITLFERRRGKRLWIFDALLLLGTGVAGAVLFLMLFSQHPTVRVNLQILVYNPLALVFAWSILRKLRHGQHSRPLTALVVMYAASLVAACTMQQFAQGTILLALTLIMRFSITATKKQK